METKLENLLIESIKEAVEVLSTTEDFQSKLVQLEVINSYSYNLVEYYADDEEVETEGESKLERFLFIEKITDAFKLNLKAFPINGITDLDEYVATHGDHHRAILNSFKWEEAPEGIQYWEKLSLKFIEEFEYL